MHCTLADIQQDLDLEDPKPMRSKLDGKKEHDLDRPMRLRMLPWRLQPYNTVLYVL